MEARLAYFYFNLGFTLTLIKVHGSQNSKFKNFKKSFIEYN